MSYNDIQDYDLPALEKIWSVLTRMRYSIEISDSKKIDIGFKYGKEEPVIPEDDWRVLGNLEEQGIIDFLQTVQGNGYILCSITSKKIFYDFYYKIADRIKELKPKTDEMSNHATRLKFDEPKSILMIQDYKIIISRRKENNDEHEVLKHLFKDVNDTLFYSELAKDISDIEPDDYKTKSKYWQKFYGACERIQEKVKEVTENKIDDFLNFSTGITGSVKINKKYIPKVLLTT